MVPDLAALERIERDVWEDAYLAAPQSIRDKFGLRIERVGEARWLCASSLSADYCRLLGLGLDDRTDDAVRCGLARYAEAGVRSFKIQVPPWVAPPPSLSTLRSSTPWAKLYRDAGPIAEVVSGDLRIVEEASSETSLFGLLCCTGFDEPSELAGWNNSLVGRQPWRIYLALDGNTPLASGALFVKNRIGWLGFGSTLSAQRRRGAHAALIARRIRDGLAVGCETFVVETEELDPSYRNYLRAGFQLAYLRPNYELPDH